LVTIFHFFEKKVIIFLDNPKYCCIFAAEKPIYLPNKTFYL